VMGFTILFFILGWVYVLTGAAMAKARIFLPALGLFAFQLFIITGGGSFAACAEVVFIFFFLIVYAITFRTRFWRDYPFVHFFIWLAILLFFMFFSVGFAETDAQVANSITANFSLILLLTLLFWVFLGLDIMNLGISIGRALTKIARRFLPFPALSALTLFILIAHPTFVLVLMVLTEGWIWLFDLALSIPLALGAVVIWFRRRWNLSTTATFLSLSLASPVASLGLSMSLSGTDMLEALLALTGIFPPLLLFVGLTTYNLLGTGITFTSVDGKIIPRDARIPLYFGTVILVITFMLLMSNERVADTGKLFIDVQGMINGLFMMGGIFLGLPYVIWLIFKRREEIIGNEDEFMSPPRWLWLERIPARAFLTLSLISACLCSTILMAILGWYVNVYKIP
ncbi:MAG: hypothetical protein MUO77_04400, partial [Anaerolineales bacterium]|nr:hypothetical protein [Anaerolineales bacterium]